MAADVPPAEEPAVAAADNLSEATVATDTEELLFPTPPPVAFLERSSLSEMTEKGSLQMRPSLRRKTKWDGPTSIWVTSPAKPLRTDPNAVDAAASEEKRVRFQATFDTGQTAGLPELDGGAGGGRQHDDDEVEAAAAAAAADVPGDGAPAGGGVAAAEGADPSLPTPTPDGDAEVDAAWLILSATERSFSKSCSCEPGSGWTTNCSME